MQRIRKCGVLLLGLIVPAATHAATPSTNEPVTTTTMAVSDTTPVTANGPVTTVTNIAKTTISIGTEILDGDTTYQIGYPVTMDGQTAEGYFPFSELKWPLDVVMARIDGSATFYDKWRVKGTLKKDLTNPDSYMEDSDWITDSNPNRLDIFSQSSISNFDGLIIDVDVEYIFSQAPQYLFYGGLGYQYQKFSYSANLIEQYSPSGLSGFDHIGDGGVGITYKVNYHMPYLILGGDFTPREDLSFSASFAYSPYVRAKDEDHHLLREYGGKVTEGDMDGDAFMLDVSGKYKFTPRWFVELGFTYAKIDVDGTMDQSYVWFGHFASNRVDSDSTQTSGYLSIGAEL